MIQSMTGYGKAVVAYKGKKINVEVKSLNSKALARMLYRKRCGILFFLPLHPVDKMKAAFWRPHYGPLGTSRGF